MSLRTKVLWLLLAIALIPLIAVTAVAQLSTRAVSAAFVGDAREYLQADTEEKLEQVVRAYASYVGRTVEALNVAVSVQARDASRALSGDLSPDGRFVLASDLDAGIDLPVDYAPHDSFTRLTAERQREPIRVSLSTVGVVAPPGLDGTPMVEARASELAALIPTFTVLRKLQPGLIAWQYAATIEGVHASYPAHGGYPAGYDPRSRPWYTIAASDSAATAAPRWSPPSIDATSRHALLTVSHAVHADDGRLLGVTGIDIRLTDILSKTDSWTEGWGADADVSLIATGLAEDGDADGIDDGIDRGETIVFARREYEQSGSWTSPISIDRLALDTPEAVERVRANLISREVATFTAVKEGVPVLCAVAPVLAETSDADETVSAGVLIALPLADVLALADTAEAGFVQRMRLQLGTNIAIALAVGLAVVMIALVVSRTVTRPVRALARAAERVAAGDLEARADVARGDEIGALAEAFDTMVPKLRDGLRMSSSLEMAKHVQQRLLPSSPPTHPGFDIAGLSRYCDETGGDYYDFFELGTPTEPRTCVVLGDVTGHGVAAAMLMATGRALLRSQTAHGGELAEQLTQINRDLCRDATDGRFMTLGAIVINTDGSLLWASAGHDPAIVFSPRTKSFREFVGAGIPLGIEPTWMYEQHPEAALESGDVIVLSTDGIWEARNPAGEMFGKDRLREVIQASRAASADQIAKAILEAVDTFQGSEPQADDITMAVVKRLG